MSLTWNCREKGCYKAECLPDWGFLEGAFVRGIKPTDVDGVVEVNGHYLYLEWKNRDGRLKEGQARYFMRLTADSSKNRVYVIFGDSKASSVERLQIIKDGIVGDAIECDAERLAGMCRRWTEYAMSDKVRPNPLGLSESEIAQLDAIWAGALAR